MKKTRMNDKWKFWLNKDSFALVWNVPGDAREVTLPHDAMIEAPASSESKNGGNTGFRDAEVYGYKKEIFVPAEDEGKSLILKFEGIYMNAFIYVNGQLAAKNHYGYTDIYADLTPFLKYGKVNEIRVEARAGAMSNSRWYSGAGIYRDVYLLEGGKIHMVPGGLQVSTEKITSEYAVIRVKTTIRNRDCETRRIVTEICIKDACGKVLKTDSYPLSLFPGEERHTVRKLAVPDALLWDEHDPNLYQISCVIRDEKGRFTDEEEDRFGIRIISLDTVNGFSVNGKTVNLRGACIHHDSGILGAATYEDAQYRQIRLLKEAGFNAVRMAHQPMAPAMLRACDELGVYVMDEISDMWNHPKTDYDYGLFFHECWKEDVLAVVHKDYNHPSVVMFSIGNEIPEIGTDQGSKIASDMNNLIKEADDSRLVLASINGLFAAGDKAGIIISDVAAAHASSNQSTGNINDFMTSLNDHMDEIVCHPIISERLDRACANLDVAGYNYMAGRYELDSRENPNRIIVGSETYAQDIAKNWDLVEKLPTVIGDFSWTGWDYLGEAGLGVPSYASEESTNGSKYPVQLAYCGDFDLIGHRRPASYFREIVYGFRKEPYITIENPYHAGETLIKNSWTFSDAVSSLNFAGCEGKAAVAEILSAGDEVELIHNGISLGRKKAGKEVGYRTKFDFTYQPGEMTAITFENGREIARTVLKSAEGAPCLEIIKEDNPKKQELTYLNIVLKGQNGVTYTDRDRELSLETEDLSRILAFGSGDPKPVYNYKEYRTKLYLGQAQVILKSPKAGENLKLKVTAATGETAEITVAGIGDNPGSSV